MRHPSLAESGNGLTVMTLSGHDANWLYSPTGRRDAEHRTRAGSRAPDAAAGTMRPATTKPVDIGVRAAAVMNRARLEWLTAERNRVQSHA